MYEKNHGFSSYHPSVNLFFFTVVLLFTMFYMHPITLVISFVSALIYVAELSQKKELLFMLKFLLPSMMLVMIINPLFQHEGATILAYFPGGNPLTLESLIYGLASGILLGAVLLWFRCYTVVMTSDKVMYLFGKILPHLSLFLAMSLSFVPKFTVQCKLVYESQSLMTKKAQKRKFIQKTKMLAKVFSMMITWSLENAIETADSMKSRGYGLPGRSAFSLFKLRERDKNMLIFLSFAGIYLLFGSFAGVFSSYYFPVIFLGDFTAFHLSFHFIFALLCLTPSLISRKEDALWKKLKSQ